MCHLSTGSSAPLEPARHPAGPAGHARSVGARCICKLVRASFCPAPQLAPQRAGRSHGRDARPQAHHRRTPLSPAATPAAPDDHRATSCYHRRRRAIDEQRIAHRLDVQLVGRQVPVLTELAQHLLGANTNIPSDVGEVVFVRGWQRVENRLALLKHVDPKLISCTASWMLTV